MKNSQNKFRRTAAFFSCAVWLMVVYALAVSQGTETPRLIDILPVSPLTIEREGGLFQRPSSGLDVVGIGAAVYLRARSPLENEILSQIHWSFDETPGERMPEFLAQDNAITAFIPEDEGIYFVRMNAVRPSGEAISDSRRIIAATYLGVGNLNPPQTPQIPECAICHPGNAGLWLETAHAHSLHRLLDGHSTATVDESCFACHATGFDPDPRALNNGFDDIAREAGVDISDLAAQANLASQIRQDGAPDTNIYPYELLAPSVRAMANAQCEMCHGPGSQHMQGIDRIAKSWPAAPCAQCHDGMRNDGTIYTFDSSRHPTLTTPLRRGDLPLEPDCAMCHTSEGFVRVQVRGGDPTMGLSSGVEPHGVSCVACHDPHSNHIPGQLRLTGDTPLRSGHVFRTQGRDGLCVACHNAHIPPDLADFIANDPIGPRCGAQADVMLGANAWDFGMGFETTESVHMLTIQESCIDCHMAQVPIDGFHPAAGALVGGHSFKVSNPDAPSGPKVNIRNACTPCHMTMTSIDRPLFYLRDYDGDGVVGGIQTEVRGLLRRISDILQERYPELEAPSHGEMNIPEEIYARMEFNEKAAVHNYRLIFRDGSFGIHNARFAVEVLQKTYQALTGRTLAQDFPKAFMVGATEMEDWLMHE